MTDTPMVPVAWGELLDKITILEIKRARIRSPGSVANIERGLTALAAVPVGPNAPSVQIRADPGSRT